MQIQIPPKTKSLCAFARRMITDGADPDEPADWYRGETKIFAQSRPLRWWAERSVTLDLQFEKFNPMDDEAKARLKSRDRSARTRPLAVSGRVTPEKP